MSNIRVKKEREFSTIDNEPLNDKSLSMESMALLVYLLSKPDNWKARKGEIIKRFIKNTKNKIESAFKELIASEYAILEKIRGEDGKLSGSEYLIFERPSLCRAYQKAKSPRQEISDLGNVRDSENFEGRENPAYNNNDASNKTDFINKTEKEKEPAPDGAVCPSCGTFKADFRTDKQKNFCQACQLWTNTNRWLPINPEFPNPPENPDSSKPNPEAPEADWVCKLCQKAPATKKGGCCKKCRHRLNGKRKDPDRFEEFWPSQIRKVGKGAAKKAWDKALKRTPSEDIIKAWKSQRAYYLKRLEIRGTDPPNPATWLNQERWQDEVDVKSIKANGNNTKQQEQYDNPGYKPFPRVPAATGD
jgi:hypothetical protein